MLVPVKCYLPLFTPLRISQNELAYQRSIAQRDAFIEQVPQAIEDFAPEIQECGATLGEFPKEVFELIKSRASLATTRWSDHLTLAFKVDVDETAIEEINSPKKFDLEWIYGIAVTRGMEIVESILTVSELAYPGAINALEGYCFSNESGCRISKKQTFYFMSEPDPDDPIWPDIQTIELIKCVRWAKKLGFSNSAFSDSKAGNALAAFSHIVKLGIHFQGETMFRAMQGLEAFYCDGNGDLRRQLSSKVKLWLGPWQDSRNTVGLLYDMRSKFVHGSTNLEYANHHRDAWEENEKAASEQSYYTDFSVRLLTGTLQKCILQDVTNIQWSFSYQIGKEAQ